MLFEVCVDTFESAKNAELGGADRIELCAALSEDGLTPSYGFAAVCLDQLSLEVYPMIRPRDGSFVYSEEELLIMIEDIKQFKALGVHGVVFGVLTEDDLIDETAMTRLIKAADPLPVTCHRAFDQTPDPVQALDSLIKMKVARVLTSGQQSTAEAGIDMLKSLVTHVAERIIIMPGAGIKSCNIEALLTTNAQEYHGSAKAGHTETNIAEVRTIKSLLNA